GAPMSAACLTLLHASGAPIWPWTTAHPGLLVEAFPAAQLKTWRLPYVGYNRAAGRGPSIRAGIIEGIEQRIAIDGFRDELQKSADVIDAVVCAFAAVAVTASAIAVQPSDASSTEGWIAVHG